MSCPVLTGPCFCRAQKLSGLVLEERLLYLNLALKTSVCMLLLLGLLGRQNNSDLEVLAVAKTCGHAQNTLKSDGPRVSLDTLQKGCVALAHFLTSELRFLIRVMRIIPSSLGWCEDLQPGVYPGLHFSSEKIKKHFLLMLI